MRQQPVGPAFLWTIRFLAASAAGVSGYLLYQSLTGASVAGCGPGSGCSQVLSSRWASFFNVPVSAGGLAVYLSILIGSFLVPDRNTWEVQRFGWAWLLAAAALELAAAGWFIGVQAIDLKAWCPWCLSAHAAGVAAAIMVLLRAPISNRFDPDQFHTSIRPGPALQALAGGILAAAVLAAGQLVYIPSGLGVSQELVVAQDGPQVAPAPAPAPASPRIELMPFMPTPAARPPTPPFAPIPEAAPPDSTTAPPAPAESSADPDDAQEKRIIRILTTQQNRVGLAVDLYDVPTVGSRRASQWMVKLFDYTCPSCQKLHQQLEEVRPHFGDDLIVALLPVPLLHDCNPEIPDLPQVRERHGDACNLARTALAVWRADRAKFLEFHHWAFTDNWPVTFARAKIKAVLLVGADAFDKAWNDPWIERQIDFDVKYYAAAHDGRGANVLPKMIFAPIVSGGVPRDAQELLQYMRQRAGLVISQ